MINNIMNRIVIRRPINALVIIPKKQTSLIIIKNFEKPNIKSKNISWKLTVNNITRKMNNFDN